MDTQFGIQQLQGVGPKRLNMLQEMGILSLTDLLHTYPKSSNSKKRERRLAKRPPTCV
jgi:RecG-like helicase